MNVSKQNDLITQYTVTEIVERSGYSKPVIKIISLLFVLLVCDSYDVAALSFVAPTLIKTWAITPQAMGLVFSVGLLGLLVGSIFFGRLGDSFGRKRMITNGTLLFGVLTVATGFASNYEQLLVLRLLAALGLGGAVPNAVALASEFSPTKLRITSVGIIFAGYSVGGVLAGLSATVLIDIFGWSMMFYAGGAISIIAALMFKVALPESLRHLTLGASNQAEAARVAKILRPDLSGVLNLKVVGDEDQSFETRTFGQLFDAHLRMATPTLWLIYIASSMTAFSLSSWMPVAVESIGLSPSAAAIATAMLYVGSAVGGVVGGRFADKFGLFAVIVLAALAIPAVSALGMLGGAPELLMPMCFVVGCLAFGTQTCLHGIAGSLYPTQFRSNGTGWAIGIAKIGSIAGPFIGGFLLPRLTGQELFIAAASPLVLVVCLLFALRAVLMRAAQFGLIAGGDLSAGWSK